MKCKWFVFYFCSFFSDNYCQVTTGGNDTHLNFVDIHLVVLKVSQAFYFCWFVRLVGHP